MCGEGTTFIVNIRTILRYNKKLTTKIDITLLIIYTLMRNIIITSTLYKIRKDNYFIWNSWLLILIMSNMWCYNWINSIIKHYNKNK